MVVQEVIMSSPAMRSRGLICAVTIFLEGGNNNHAARRLRAWAGRRRSGRPQPSRHRHLLTKMCLHRPLLICPQLLTCCSDLNIRATADFQDESATYDSAVVLLYSRIVNDHFSP
ncbi:hypothetical protein PVAP13_5NG125581 [Panicum virgatum]|uniref:Uncharacterized protein n=1 Tax=Panicum virgatum TaxID=38727 RepID=A0A8T0RRR5_PANVG|nr:hypothetical protein PVAP13_5NG125581 [Panicum virgatum]